MENRSVFAANIAPTLDSIGTPKLTTISLNAFDNEGTVISDILRRSKALDLTKPAPYAPDPITDPDAGALEGIAIIAADTDHGTWEYSLDGGSNWSPLGTLGVASSRLLADEALTRLRFVPSPNFSGTVAAAITFRAWDQTTGVNGGLADSSFAGGSSAFSTETETASITVSPSPGLLTGVATIGDSIAGEYQFVPGGQRDTARGWVEQLDSSRGINFGEFRAPPATWDNGGPNYRESGRQFNWGSPPPLPTGILDGVTQQIASGEVSLVYYAFGQLHIAGRFADIYSGALSGAALTQLIDNAIDETSSALDTLLAAGNARIILQNFGEVGQTAFYQQVFPDASKRQLVVDAVEEANAKLLVIADERHIPVVELIEISYLASSTTPLLVGGVEITKTHVEFADAPPTHFLVDLVHPGTVVMGLLGNMVIEAANRAYGAGLAPLSDQEILVNAGLTPPTEGPTFFDVSQFVHFNVAPRIASVSNTSPSGQVPEGEIVSVAATFVDEKSGYAFEGMIDWGDGSPPTIGNLNSTEGTVTGSHQYVEGGLYEITVTVSDGFKTDSQIITAMVSGAGVHGGVLQIIGTTRNDRVQVRGLGGDRCNGPAWLQVRADFLSNLGSSSGGKREFASTGISEILILLGDGDDDATIDDAVKTMAAIDGGAGKDNLKAGGGSSILLGGLGDDNLTGGQKRDLLVGGLGRDKLVAKSEDDILIGGITSYDADYAALAAILDEWNSTRNYASRVANLMGPTGSVRNNGEYFLRVDGPNRTVFDDCVDDLLAGGRGRDWYFASLAYPAKDKLAGKAAGEAVSNVYCIETATLDVKKALARKTQ